MNPRNRSLFPERYEVELYRDLIKKLNSLGFEFKEKAGYSDLVDEVTRVLVEVKLGRDIAENGASQILYEVAKNEIEDMLYLGLADSELFHLFKTPEYGNILTFAKKLDSTLSQPPSSFSGKKIGEAFVVLGKPIWQGFWRKTDDDISKILSGDTIIPFIAENLFDFHRIFGLYGIRVPDIISAFTGGNVTHVEVTKDRIIISKSRGDPISIPYEGEMKHTHKWILERVRIPDIKDIEKLRQTSDRLQSKEMRAKRGAYYTEEFLSMKMSGKVLELIEPDFIIEPYAGAGSLLIPFMGKVFEGWVNDYDEGAYIMLKADYEKIGYKVTKENLVRFPISDALDIIGDAKNPLFITNPPFSSPSGGNLDEIEGNEILDNRYGTGNQVYQTIGKLIEIIKALGHGYLAFFCPMGVFCERHSHMKFLNEILSNFTFIDGYIWSGEHFNDVYGAKNIAFTIWKFGGSTILDNIKFDSEDYGPVGFRRHMLLKDGWRYDNRKVIRGEICIQGNDRFNVTHAKVFHIQPKKGGSEVIPENVKKPLKINNIPSELAYALWSRTVGFNSIIRNLYNGCGRPLYVGDAYVRLPNFKNEKTLQILTYAIVYVFLAPDTNYTDNNIGFIGPRKTMKFGKSTNLNRGVQYLLETYGHLPIGEQTIVEVMEDIKKGEKNDDWFQLIVKEIANRLDDIGYWDYIPLPLKQNNSTLF